MRHTLKTNTVVFQDVWDEKKTYEVRRDDRNFKLGDELLLVETYHTGEEMDMGAPLQYTGRYVLLDVMHKLKGEYGLLPDFCVLGCSYIQCGDGYEEEA